MRTLAKISLDGSEQCVAARQGVRLSQTLVRPCVNVVDDDAMCFRDSLRAYQRCAMQHIAQLDEKGLVACAHPHVARGLIVIDRVCICQQRRPVHTFLSSCAAGTLGAVHDEESVPERCVLDAGIGHTRVDVSQLCNESHLQAGVQTIDGRHQLGHSQRARLPYGACVDGISFVLSPVAGALAIIA